MGWLSWDGRTRVWQRLFQKYPSACFLELQFLAFNLTNTMIQAKFSNHPPLLPATTQLLNFSIISWPCRLLRWLLLAMAELSGYASNFYCISKACQCLYHIILH
jgi:hypothetical protein